MTGKLCLYASVIVVLLCACVPCASAQATWVTLPIKNPSMSSTDGRAIHGWTFHNARMAKGDVGGEIWCAEMPVIREDYSRIFQRLHFVPGTVKKFRVTARLLTKAFSPDDTTEESQDARLRITLYPAGAEWDWEKALWPKGRSGALHRIRPANEWGWQTFELECAAEAEALEVGLECMNPPLTVFAEEMKLEALLNQGETVAGAFNVKSSFAAAVSSAKPEKAETESGAVPSDNSLWGLSTDFEMGGAAGWQHHIVDEYPPSQIDFLWETNQPGEGARSVLIKPGYAVSSMSVPVEGNTEYTVSILVRGDGALAVHVKSKFVWVQGSMLSASSEWTRKSFTFRTPADSSRGICLYLKNTGDPRSDGSVSVDAICLSEGKNKEYTPGGSYDLALKPSAPNNLVLSNRQVTVLASLKMHESGEAPSSDWRWTLNEVVPRERTIRREPVEWLQMDDNKDLHEARMELPAGQGLYRIVLLEGDEDLIHPMHELLIGQAAFDDLPEVKDDPQEAFLGVHYHNNWASIGSPPYLLNPDTKEARRWAAVHHMGARWIRLHGGRPDLTKMYGVHPDSFDETLLYVDELNALRELGFEILGLLQPGFMGDNRFSEWYEHRETTGAWDKGALPEDLDVWARYVTNVVSGYRDVISCWELFNEPNGTMTAQDYVPLLKRGYKAAKAANSNCTVLGICGSTDFGTHLDKFVYECMEKGSGESLDAISYHPYIGTRSPESGNSSGIMATMRKVRDKHAPGKPLWNSEVGWRTHPTYITHLRRTPETGNVTALNGAAYTARNILEAKRSGLVRYFMYGGACPSAVYHNLTWSPLLEYDGSPSPLYFTVGAVMRALQDAEFHTEMKLGEGVHAFLFTRSDGSVLAAVWTDNQVVEQSFMLELGNPPDKAWNGIGRLIPAPAFSVEISRVPVYLTWYATDVGQVAKNLNQASLQDAPGVYIVARLNTENDPVLILQVDNTTPTDTDLSWVPDGGATRRIVAVAGGTMEISSLALTLFRAPETLSGQVHESFYRTVPVSIGSRYAELKDSPPEGLVIDGALMEWISPSALSFGERSQITAGNISDDHFKNQPALLWAAADEEALTLAVEVSKKMRGWSQTQLGNNQWKMDSVEVFLRTRPREVNWIDPAYRNGDTKLSFAQNSEHREEKHINIDRGSDFVSTNGIDFAFSDMSGGPGYACEIEIPWTSFPDFRDGKPDFLGFDISLNLTEEGDGRTYQYTWSGSGDNWRDTRHFGVLKTQ